MPAPHLTFRPGREDDYDQVAAMTKEIWEGQDYLPKVWDEWVNAPHSVLHVGIADEQIIAVGRIIELTPGGWWMEGLRVHPAHQSKGYATQFHDHMVEIALQQPGIRTLGLATSWENEKVGHMARESGMTLRCDYRLLKGAPLPDPVLEVTAHPNATVANLLAAVRESRWLQLSDGYAMYGWVARPIDEAWLEEIIVEGGVWRCGEALALTGPNSRHDQSWLYLLVGGTLDDQAALVRHARYLTHQLDPDSHLRCFVPVDDTLYRPLLDAGMQDPWGGDDGEFHVYHFVRDVATSER